MKKNLVINNSNKNTFLSNLSLKKKYSYSYVISSSVLKLKRVLANKQKVISPTFAPIEKYVEPKKQINSFLLSFIICFSFSLTNTFIYVTDSLGKLKYSLSGGSVKFKGKQKKVRILVLTRFLRELRKLKISILKNKSVALHLNNVGSYKYFIIKNMKKHFYIRLIKNYNTFPYNGCRKRKRLRKR